MFSSSTSAAESVAVGEIRSQCGAAVLQTAVDVVRSASRVGSVVLQAGVDEQKPVPECLLKSIEAISSSRLCSNTHAECRQEEKKWQHLREDREKRNLETQH